MGDAAAKCPTCSQGEGRRDSMLVEKYGTRPKRYASYISSRKNEAQGRFVRTLPKAYAHASAIAKRYGFEVSKAEIATNILSEGAVLALQGNVYEGLDGFGAFGVDTLVDRKKELWPFLDARTKKIVNEPWMVVEKMNEKGETVHSITMLSLEEGMYANASMYVWSKSRLARDLAARGMSIDDLPPEAQFFWSTVYFNAGPSQGKKHLESWGVDAWQEPWTAEDDAVTYGRDSRYNAHWRTATFESVSEASDPPRDTEAPPWE
jgi:hypothetical protein